MNINNYGQRFLSSANVSQIHGRHLTWRRCLLLMLTACALTVGIGLRAQCPPPTIICAADKTVPCGSPWTNDPPMLPDPCCGPSNILTHCSVTSGVCPQVIQFKWIVTNCSGFTASCTQTVTVIPMTPPIVACATNKTVACGSSWAFDPPVVLSSCCGTGLTITVLSTVTNGPCPPVATRIWMLTDCCTNSISCTQAVTVVGDTTPPVLTCAPNKTVLCGSTWAFDPPSAYDACCGTNVMVGILSTLTNGLCPQVISRIWGAADCCGNFITCTQAVTVVSLLCAPNKIVECSTPWTFDPPTSTNLSCCATSIVVGTFTNPGVCLAAPVISRVWMATDCCTNTLICTQIVTVVDTTPPFFFAGVPAKTVGCGSVWSFDTPSAFDACCGTNVTITIASTVTNGSTCPPVISRTWKATDCCSNSSFFTQFVTNTADTIPPFMFCGTNKTVQCGTAWSFDAPFAFDGFCCGSNVIVGIFSTVTNGSCPQVITRTWEAADCCTNIAFCSQTITNVDTNPPVLTCASNKTVFCGTFWTFDPPIAFDLCCGTNVVIGIVSTVTNTGCPQVITRTWGASDCCFNMAFCSQSVTNLATNSSPPAIFCPSNITVLTCSSNIPVSWSVTATNACNSVTLTSTPSSGSLFARDTTNTVVSVATDACGNTNTCSFLVIVRKPALTAMLGVTPGIVTVSWPDGGVLQEATNVLGPWIDLPTASSPYDTDATAPQKFYRLHCP